MDPHGSHAVRGFRQLKAELVVLQSRVEGEATDRAKLERAPRQTCPLRFLLVARGSFVFGFLFRCLLGPRFGFKLVSPFSCHLQYNVLFALLFFGFNVVYLLVSLLFLLFSHFAIC